MASRDPRRPMRCSFCRKDGHLARSCRQQKRDAAAKDDARQKNLELAFEKLSERVRSACARIEQAVAGMTDRVADEVTRRVMDQFSPARSSPPIRPPTDPRPSGPKPSSATPLSCVAVPHIPGRILVDPSRREPQASQRPHTIPEPVAPSVPRPSDPKRPQIQVPQTRPEPSVPKLAQRLRALPVTPKQDWRPRTVGSVTLAPTLEGFASQDLGRRGDQVPTTKGGFPLGGPRQFSRRGRSRLEVGDV